MRNRDRSIVLGAGPSGLATAWAIITDNKDKSAMVIEKSAKVGGLCGAIEWNGHRVDIGPHRLSPNLPRVRRLAEYLLGPELQLKKSQHGVFISAKLYQFPPRIIDWISPSSVIFLVRSVLSFFASKLVWIGTRYKQDSFISISENTFGRYFSRSIVFPMARKVWCEPEDIDSSFAQTRFGHISPRAFLAEYLKKIKTLNPDTFLYPKYGFSQLSQRLREDIESRGGKVLTESSVVQMRILDDTVSSLTVRGVDGAEVIVTEFSDVVSTIPLTELVRALDWDDPDFSEAKQLLKNVKFRSMLLVLLEYEEKIKLPYRVIIAPSEDVIFNRIFDQGLYSKDTVAAGKSVFVADITTDFGSRFYNENDQDIVGRVIKDVDSLGLVNIPPIATKLVRIPYAYVVPDSETREAMYRIRFVLRRIRNLHLTGRFSAGEYDNSDYAIENGFTVGRVISGSRSFMEYIAGKDDGLFLTEKKIVG